MRKLFNSVLSFALFVVVFTTNVQAIDNSVVETVNKQTESLSQVIHDAQQNAIIRLEEDITVDEIITITNKKVTLDLNDQTLTFTNPETDSLIVAAGSELTVVGGQSGTIISPVSTKVMIRNYGKTTILSGIFGNATLNHYGLVLGNGSSVSEIEGGTFNSFITSNGSQSGQSLVIKGGSFNRQIYLASANTTTTITGGNFNVSASDTEVDSAIEIDAGILNISGGTFTHNVATTGNSTAITNNNGTGYHKGVITAIKPSSSASNAYGSNIEVNITGGTFTNTLGDVLVLANHATTYNEAITHITVDIFEDIIPTNKIAIYDNIADSRGESIVNVLPNKRVSIGDTYYSTLEDAISAAKKGDTIKVLKDFTVNKVASIKGKDITLDLNGKTLSFGPSLDFAFNISMFAKLTVDDSSSQKPGRITNANNNADIFRNSGTLVINAGEFGEIVKNQYAVLLTSISKTTINGGTFNGVIYSNGTSSNQTLTITGGTFKDMLYLAGYNTLTEISGGRFEPDSLSGVNAAIEINAGTLNITDGHFELDILTNSNTSTTPTNNNGSGDYKGVIVAVKPTGSSATGYASPISLTIKGGTFENSLGQKVVLANRADVQLTGVTEIIANVESNLFGDNALKIFDNSGIDSKYATKVNYKTFGALQIGSLTYDSLAEALAAAQSGDTIKVLRDLAINKGVEVSDKAVTLDLNGKSIEFGPNIDPSILIKHGAKLTVTDSTPSKLGTITNVKNGTDIFRNGGELVLKAGTFGEVDKDHYVVYMLRGNSSTVIDGGTINGLIYSNGSTAGQQLTINGGTFKGMLYLAAKDTYTLITGGHFEPHVATESNAAIEIDAGTLVIEGGTFVHEILTNTNSVTTSTNNNGTGGYKGVIVAVKPTGTTADGYGSTIYLSIKGGTFTNSLGDVLVLANKADVQVPSVTDIRVEIYEGILTEADYHIYDKLGLDTEFTSKVDEYLKVNYVIVKDNLEVTYFNQFVLKGSKAMLPSLPFYSGYVTDGWLNADQAITGNTTLKAYFTVEQFEVVFYDHTGNVIDTQTVEYGKAATAPTGMTRVGYTFKGWDTPFSSVTTDLEVKPIYEVIPIEDKVESNLGELVVKGLESVLTPEEIAAGVTAAVEVGELSLDLLDEEEKQILADFFKSVLKTDNPTVILLDITVKKVSANGSEPISETSGEIELSFDLPKAFEGKSFNVIRIHNGVIEILEHEIDPVTGAVTFKTDRFSTYGVVSSIAPTPEQPNEPGSPVQPNVPVTPEQPKEDGKLPTTGIQSNTSSGYLFLILGFAIILSNKRVRKYSKRSH